MEIHMLKHKLLITGLLMVATTTASAIPYGFFDARSVAMGNVSVATSNLTTAALSNPAMLARNESNDKFALLIPGIGIQAADNGGIADLIDDYQALEANAITGGPQTVADLNTILTKLDDPNTFVGLNGNISAVLAYAGDDYSVALSYRGVADVTARVNVTQLAVLPGTQPAATLDAFGVIVQEIGASFATKISLLGMDVSIGVTPKTVQVDLVTLVPVDLSTVDIADSIGDGVETNLGSFTTMDAGIAIGVTDGITLGLVAKNLIEESLTDGTSTFNFDKQLRAGVAYRNEFLTIAADMDLTEINPPTTTNTSYAVGNASKVAALGIEFDLGDIVQLRAGYQTNMANNATTPDLLSVGVGLWLGFHLDIAAVVGDDSSFGAFVQTGFRF